MTPQESINILKTELCSRLPYKLKCMVSVDCTEFDEFYGRVIGFKGKAIGELYLVDLNDEHVELYFEGDNPVDIEMSNMSMEGLLEIWDCQPYLRPMSSMTDEEKLFVEQCIDCVSDENYGDHWSPSAWDSMMDFTNYCNKRHLDVNGLIPKGLALEAPKDMYKTE